MMKTPSQSLKSTEKPKQMEIDCPTPTSSSPFNESQGQNKRFKKGILKGVKKVTFSIPNTRIYIDKKSKREIRSSWYSEDEIDRFKKKTLESAKALMEESAPVAKAYIERSVAVDFNESSGRFSGIKHICGIEHLLCRAVCGMLLATRSESILGVIEEQKRQALKGERNHQMIAQVYMEKALFAKAWRYRIAVINSSTE